MNALSCVSDQVIVSVVDAFHCVMYPFIIVVSHHRGRGHAYWLIDRRHLPPSRQTANSQTRKIGRPPRSGQEFALAYSDGWDSLPFVVEVCRFLYFQSVRQYAPMYCHAHLPCSDGRARDHTEECTPYLYPR